MAEAVVTTTVVVGGGGVGGEPVAHRTRGALEEIPRPATVVLGQTQTGNLINGLTWPVMANHPSSYRSPTPSPDELIIRGRGRRSLPLEWSPIPIESPIKRSEKTPIKRLPGKGMIVLRSSPRKRLQLTDTPPKDLLEGRRMMMQMSPIVKRCKSLTMSPQSPPEVAIKGLSQNQLVDVLSHVLSRHPELKDEISNILPQPDIKHMEEKLNHMKRTIFKSLPMSRLASKTDSPAFNKASPHLLNFKKNHPRTVQSAGRSRAMEQPCRLYLACVVVCSCNACLGHYPAQQYQEILLQGLGTTLLTGVERSPLDA